VSIVAAIHRITDTWHDLVRIVFYQENMNRNCHHAKFSIPVSAAAVILEILHILGRGFRCSCARTFSHCCSCSALPYGREPIARVLHACSYILQSEYDG